MCKEQVLSDVDRERLVGLAAETIMSSGSGEISEHVAESAATCIVDMVISEIAKGAESRFGGRTLRGGSQPSVSRHR